MSNTGQATGRFERLVTHLQDAVVEFELDGAVPIILSVNPAFERIFGCENDAVVGTSLNELIVPVMLDREASAFDARTAAGKSNRAIVNRRTADGVRQFLYRSVPYSGGDRGVAIYTDITDQFRNDRQLAVLYRILRHNLRNDLNIVGGYAELIAGRTDDRFVAAYAETIVKTAQQLLKLSNEARDFERVLNADQTVEPIRLEPIVDRVIDTCGSRFPAGTIEQSTVSGCTVRAGEYLELALEALVDNGLRHSAAETPWVRIDATVDAGTVAITVCDNGPGIPPAERAVVTGERSITPLEHGSGLGLWLVAAVGDVYGGRVEFAERDGGGSEVTILLPEAEP